MYADFQPTIYLLESAITREKHIKKWIRAWKLELIENAYPDWRDLAEDFGFAPLA